MLPNKTAPVLFRSAADQILHNNICQTTISSLAQNKSKSDIFAFLANKLTHRHHQTASKMSSSPIKRMIDIGANLTDPMFRGFYHGSHKHASDFNHMLERAKLNGVEKMIITGGTLSESRQALETANKDSALYSTVGCHPTRCNEFVNHPDGPDAYLSALKDLALSNSSKIVAIGETGLDYDRLQFCAKDTQANYFEQQLSIAEATRKPLFLHNRNSSSDMIQYLTKNRDKFASGGGVVHSFDGSQDDLRAFLDLGLYIGINGCSLKTEDNLQVAKQIPSDRLMIETDCPYCEIRRTHASFKYIKTHFHKTKDASDKSKQVKGRNEPASIIQVLEVLSAIRDADLSTLAEQVYENTNRLFFPFA